MAAMSILRLVVTFLGSLFKSQRQLLLENLALRQQVTMLRQSVKRYRATAREWRNPSYPSIPEITKQPDAVDAPDACLEFQALAAHERRRVRQLRRVGSGFLATLLPF